MNEVDMQNLALHAASEHDARMAEEHNAKAREALDEFYKRGLVEVRPAQDQYLLGYERGKEEAFDQLRADCIDRAMRLQIQPGQILEYAERFYQFITKTT